MIDERKHDWDWVKAIGMCQATVLFGELKALAQGNVSTRNKQLNLDRFGLTEVHGLQFSVDRKGEPEKRIFFTVSDDLKAIRVGRINGDEIATYTVRLDDDGMCRLFVGNDKLDHWQVLKNALEPLLFR